MIAVFIIIFTIITYRYHILLSVIIIRTIITFILPVLYRNRYCYHNCFIINIIISSSTIIIIYTVAIAKVSSLRPPVQFRCMGGEG